MSLSRALSDPLIMLELTSQARRPNARHCSYPGPLWAALLALIPFCYLIWGRVDSCWWYWTVCLIGETWLLLSRSGASTASSISVDVEQGVFSVLASSPLGVGRAVVSKMVAALLPLWIECSALTFVCWVSFTLGGEVPHLTMALAFVWQLSLSLLGASVGLILGVYCGDCAVAVKVYRRALLLCTVVLWLMGRVWDDPFIAIVLAIVFLLFVAPCVFPRQTGVFAVVATLAVALVPLACWTSFWTVDIARHQFGGSGYVESLNPIVVAWYYASPPLDFAAVENIESRCQNDWMLFDYLTSSVVGKRELSGYASFDGDIEDLPDGVDRVDRSQKSNLRQICASINVTTYSMEHHARVFKRRVDCHIIAVTLLQGLFGCLLAGLAYLRAQRCATGVS